MTSKVLDYVYVFFLNECAYLALWRRDEGIRYPGTGLTDGREPPCRLGTQPSSLQELSTSESSLALKDKVLKAKGILLCAAVRAQR